MCDLPTHFFSNACHNPPARSRFSHSVMEEVDNDTVTHVLDQFHVLVDAQNDAAAGRHIAKNVSVMSRAAAGRRRDRFARRQLIVSEILDLDLMVEVDINYEMPPVEGA